MRYLLTLPEALLLLSVLLFVIACLMVALAILKWGRLIPLPVNHVPVPAFIGVIATTWALSLGFAASDLWLLGSRADQAVTAERSAVMRLVGSAAPAALDVPELRENIMRYVQLVERSEHMRNAADALGDPEVNAAVQDIRVTVLQIAASGTPGAVAAKIVNDFDELQDARNVRLAMRISLIDTSKWYLLVSLTFMTMVTIALVHIDRPLAGRNASVIFAIVAFSGLWVLVVHVDPFTDQRTDYLSHGLGPSFADA